MNFKWLVYHIATTYIFRKLVNLNITSFSQHYWQLLHVWINKHQLKKNIFRSTLVLVLAEKDFPMSQLMNFIQGYFLYVPVHFTT